MNFRTLTLNETEVPTLGEAKIDSPVGKGLHMSREKRVLYRPYLVNGNYISAEPASFQIAGPRNKIYFDPKKVKAAIVTCGGICPGLNDVIRGITLGLHRTYGVKSIFGIKNGWQGFIPKYKHDVVDLTPENVSTIHEMGGTILGTSRGEQPIDEIVDALERMNINLLFTIGGDGTLNATHRIYKEVTERNLKISIIGLPKTIDNDISYVDQSFGFETAVENATLAVRSASVEAKSSQGVGLVKLMGRESGFVAVTTALSQRDVDFVMIPEQDFELDGENGLLAALRKKMADQGHAVVVVAEGAGQKFFSNLRKETDPSGNLKLNDIGLYLKDKIKEDFDNNNITSTIKYIDPSYIIRSVPSNTRDGYFCAALAQNAVHAAMAGSTGILISSWHGEFCELPIPLAISARKQVDLEGNLWASVLEYTGQPDFKNPK